MTTYNELRVKAEKIDACMDIASDLDWRFNNLLETKKALQEEVAQNNGIVDENLEMRINSNDARIEVYTKVYAFLDKI